MHINRNLLALIFLTSLFILTWTNTTCFAEEDFSLDDIMNEFDSSTDESINSEKIDTAPLETESNASMFSINGSFKFGAVCNISHHAPAETETDWSGLSSLYGELQAELKMKFSNSWQARAGCRGSYDAIYEIKDRDDYTDDILDNYEKEIEILEAYIQGSITDSLDIKIGRQIIVWGKSDIIRVTDILNPLNTRELGATEIEDLRLPVTMTRLDYYLGNWSITTAAIHEIRFNKNPEYGSDFYPYDTEPPHEKKPSDSLDNTEFALAANGIFSGWDLSLYYANILDDFPHISLRSMNLAGLSINQKIEMRHARLWMCGAAFNVALGNLLFKTEAAFLDGIKFFNYPEFNPQNQFSPAISRHDKYSRIDALAGIEYSGFENTTISIELVNRHINSFDDRQEAFLNDFHSLIQSFPSVFGDIINQFPNEPEEDEFQSALFITRTFLNETLTLSLIVSAFDGTGQGGSFGRFTVEYDVSDALILTAGAALYQSGYSLGFEDITNNDRVFINFQYSF